MSKKGKDKANEKSAEGGSAAAAAGAPPAGWENKMPLGQCGFNRVTLAGYKEVKDGYCSLDGSHIVVRAGPNYPKLKKKAPSAPAFFECISVEGFNCPKNKQSHISQFLIFPDAKPEPGGIRPYLVCNFMLPTYGPPNPLWGSVVEDGPGWNLAMVFALTAAGREALTKETSAGAKLVKKFLTCDDGDPVRERLKAIARLANLNEAPLNFLIKRVVQTYNNTLPWMTRPQQQFFKGPNYLEISFDAHQYRYPARKTFHMFHPSIVDHIFDVAFVIETDRDDELPEHIIGSCRFSKLDQSKHKATVAESVERFKAMTYADKLAKSTAATAPLPCNLAPAQAMALAMGSAAAIAATAAASAGTAGASTPDSKSAAAAVVATPPTPSKSLGDDVTAAEAAIANALAEVDAAEAKQTGSGSGSGSGGGASPTAAGAATAAATTSEAAATAPAEEAAAPAAGGGGGKKKKKKNKK